MTMHTVDYEAKRSTFVTSLDGQRFEHVYDSMTGLYLLPAFGGIKVRFDSRHEAIAFWENIATQNLLYRQWQSYVNGLFGTPLVMPVPFYSTNEVYSPEVVRFQFNDFSDLTMRALRLNWMKHDAIQSDWATAMQWASSLSEFVSRVLRILRS